MEKMQGIGSIQFTDESEISITTLCNTGTAQFKLDKDSTMNISEVTMTILFCDEKHKEAAFVKSLSKTTSFEINKSGLKLYLNNKKEHLFFVGHY